MPSLTYPNCIRRLYESEVNGEAIFSALLKAAKSERDRYHLATLLQLEAETKAWLQPFLFKHGVEFRRPDIKLVIDQALGLYGEKGWHGLMVAAKQMATSALADFQAIAAAGPEEDQAYLTGMVRHEQAILNWINGELQGAGDESLSGVIAQLKFPIPRA